MKTAGIIGGFGPKATAKFQLEIVEIFRAKKLKTRPPLLIWQTPIPLAIGQKLVLKSQGVMDFLPFLIDGAKKLESGDADFLVMPCNTLHIQIKDLQSSVKIPILNLIEETGLALKRGGKAIPSKAKDCSCGCCKTHCVPALERNLKDQLNCDQEIPLAANRGVGGSGGISRSC